MVTPAYYASSHLVDWYIDIYTSVYGLDTSYNDIILKFNTYLKQMINNANFTVFSNIVISIGLALIVYYFFSDLSEKAIANQLSILQMGKSVVVVLISVFLIFNSKSIFIFLLNTVESLNTLVVRKNGYSEVSNFLANDTVKLLLSRCVNDHFNTISVLGYTLMAILLELVSLAAKLYVTYYAATRIIQLFVYYIFMPVGIADIFENGPGGTINMHSAGFKYIKTMVAIMLQVLVISVICQAYPLIVTSVNSGYFADRGDSSIMYDDEYSDLIEGNTRKSITYPLRNFEYTDHDASWLSITANSIWNSMKNLKDKVFGNDFDNNDDDSVDVDDTNKNQEELKDSEIYKVSDIVKMNGEYQESDEAQKKLENIQKNSQYRMTIQSTELFFLWCIGADGSKMVLFIILMITKVLMVHSSAKLCNYIMGVSV